MIRLLLVTVALAQLAVSGALSVRPATKPLQLPAQTPAQAVINQANTDRLDELNRRLDRLDARIDGMRISERLVVLEDLKSDVTSLRTVQTAIFTALVANLVATIIQIRTQHTRRREAAQEEP